MNTITTAATTYTPPGTSVVHNAQVSLTDRSPASVVHLVQYDNTLPIVAVALTANSQAYTVPSGAAVNVRLAKPDGTYVYNPALGVSADAQTAYIGTTVQMTTVWGRLNAIVEVVLNGAVAGTGIFILDITANPVPESAIESTDDFLTIQQIAAQVQQAADLVESQATNLQNLTDNLEAVQGAASNALAAENAVEEAKQAAQQALGFRTFFSAVSPDENGDLDPSRPMTTAAAQASWTVKSKGDRIQSVQVNGFTADGQSGGLRMRKVSFDTATYTQTLQNVTRFEFKIDSVTGYPALFCENIPYGTGYDSDYEHIYAVSTFIRAFVSNSKIANYESASAYLQENPVVCYYVPDDLSATTGLYIPIQAQGHEYRCQMLELTEALGSGDNVQSNVPSGCDALKVLDGSESGWALTDAGTPQKRFGLAKALDNFADNLYISNFLPISLPGDAQQKFAYMRVYTSGFLDLNVPGVDTVDDLKRYLNQNNLRIIYKSKSYLPEAQLLATIETHANGNVYAHDPVTLVAVPYTEADATAAQQLASTPSTLPYIEDADVPMLLNESDATQTTESVAPLESALPVAGTYVVSSQDGTTVQVSLKAMQDGGDAATLDGMTPSDLKEGGNAATLQGKTLSNIFDLLVPVGFIFEWAPVDLSLIHI